jgi:5-methylcytosine-specific restriction protein A
MRQGERINQLLNLEVAQPYYFHAGTWYHRLKKFPAALIDRHGYVRFETEEEYQTTPGVNITSDNQVQVRPGISGLPGYQLFSEAERTLIFETQAYPASQYAAPTDEKTLRTKREINAIVRNQKLVQEIKKLYKNTCQLCGERIQVRPGKYYSEVHHIKPLGQKHDGADNKANMLCVCPNHHALLDFFAIPLDLGTLLANKHAIGEQYVAYHNARHQQLNPL